MGKNKSANRLSKRNRKRLAVYALLLSAVDLLSALVARGAVPTPPISRGVFESCVSDGFTKQVFLYLFLGVQAEVLLGVSRCTRLVRATLSKLPQFRM